MSHSDLATMVLRAILPVLKSKSVKTNKVDFAEAIDNEKLLMWKKISSLFIKEEVFDDLRSSPENKVYRKGFEYVLTKKLEGNNKLANDLLEILSNSRKGGETKIVNQTHSGSGDNVGGDKILNK